MVNTANTRAYVLAVFLSFLLLQDVALTKAAAIDRPPAALADVAVGASTVALEAADGQPLSAMAAHQVGGVPLLFVAWSHRA